MDNLKDLNFLFVNRIDPPFKLDINEIQDKSKSNEIELLNQALKKESDSMKARCQDVKDDLEKINQLVEEIKQKIEKESSDLQSK